MQAVFEKYYSEVVAELKRDIDRSSLPLYQMLKYHMGWSDENGRALPGEQSGKLLRPVFCLTSCEAVGGDWRMALPAAAAIELIHNFSLIHDDIEDNSRERRHRPTLWSLWGQAMAINAGDAMHALGKRAMIRLLERRVPTDKVLQAVAILNQTCLRLFEGQHLDLSYEKRLDITIDDYLKMIGGKTAALLECAFELGAYLGNGEQQVVERFRACGRYLGLAFQIRDDALGIWGGEDITGKSSDSDLKQRKKTLPVVYALEKSRGDERSVLVNFYSREDTAAGDIDRVRQALEKAGGKNCAETMAMSYYSQGMDELDASGLSGEAFRNLKDMAATVVHRES